MAYNAADRKAIRRAEKDAEILERARIEFISAAMSTIQGRIWFFDFLESCRLFSDPFTADPLREAFSKGERNVGLKIYADIVGHCPDSFILMMKEANIRTEQNAARRDPAEPDADTDGEPESEPDAFS